MKRFLRKAIGSVIMYWGFACWGAGALAFVLLNGDPDFTTPKKILLILFCAVMGFILMAIGRSVWKDGQPPQPQTGGMQTVNLGAGTSSGSASLSPSAPLGAAGESSPSSEPVTVQCPGCGAPVTALPSASVECEYCGNRVHVAG